MVRISLQRVILFVGFIILAAMFFLVLTLSALSVPMTVSSPLPEGPYMVKDILPGEADSYPSPIIANEDMVYFFAYDAQGRNLWRSDGTDDGSYQLKDLNPTTGAVPNPYPQYYYPTPQYSNTYPELVDNSLYFSNDDGTHGTELWVSDGSISGTLMVKDIYSGTSSSHPINMTNVNGQLFFRAGGVYSDHDLWVSDGTITHTQIVTDLHWVTYYDLVELNGKAYFSADDGVHGAELWTSDGTDSGTYMVKDIEPESSSSYPFFLQTTDAHVFFFANNFYLEHELWVSDGTAAGTVRVQDTITETTFSVDSTFIFATTTDTNLFFTTTGNELWTSDGTISGTHFVKNVKPTYPNRYSWQAIGDRLFFSASANEYGRELWVSDGTEIGTYMVKDINPGAGDSYCSPFEPMANLNGTLFFAADDGEHGCELWMSDGTEAGTVMVQDISPGEGSSNPYCVSATEKTVFFVADDGSHGSELWSLGNMAPMAKDDTAVTRMNHPTSIPVTNNDFDVNLDAFTIVAVDDPAFGAATIDGGSIIYTPDNGFIGNDTFTYTVQESEGGLTAVAQVNVIVTGTRTYLPIILHHAGDR